MVRMETMLRPILQKPRATPVVPRTESRVAELAHVRRSVGIGIAAGTLQPGISVPRPWY